MGRKSKLDKAKRKIIKYFYSFIEEDKFPKIMYVKDIKAFFKDCQIKFDLAVNTNLRDFTKLLSSSTCLSTHIFKFPHRDIIRYTWEEVPILSLVSTLVKGSYFSHYSAIYFHNLSDQLPKNLYLNYEQKPKAISKQANSLNQDNINRAFQNKQKMTKNISIYNDYRITLINGKYTNKLGVVSSLYDGQPISVTNLERTLIDIVVRPLYSGGVSEVLNAYIRAKPFVSINRVRSYLTRLNYIYPYHQAIGFYLEKSGMYSKSQINLFKGLGLKHDFYLTYNMKNMSYSKDWRLYYPKGF